MLCAPNNSAPIIVHASGVLVAPANTAIKPSPANKSTGDPLTEASVFPKVAPIKKSGVTSPPLKPVLNVMVVRKSFEIQLHAVGPSDPQEDTILITPLAILAPNPQ